MKCKSLIVKAVALVVFFTAIYFYAAAQDSCCKPPDSLKVVSITSNQFCVSWLIKPVTPPCDSVVSSTIRYRKVGIDTWTTQTISIINGQQSVTFCASAIPCTQYEWEVKNNCKRNDSVTVSSAWVTGPNFTTLCDTASCCTPDSLKVSWVTTNQFCVNWKIKDSAACDSAIGAELQFRPVGFRYWKTVTITYSAGTTIYSYCDTAISCTLYEWRVRTICAKNGIISYSAWVTGPNFTTSCFQSKISNTNSLLKVIVSPNPVNNELNLLTENTIRKINAITVTDASGRIYQVQHFNYETKNGIIRIDVSKLLPGLYFVKVSNSAQIAMTAFFKK